MIQDPMSVLAVLSFVVAVVFWLSGRPALKRFFEYVPAIIFVYFVPMVLTTAGVIPASSPVYGWLTTYLLPFALFLLMISVDLKSVLNLGPVALFMVCAGTLGIVIGGPVAFLLFGGFLPEDAWQGFSALAGSWIGGTANMVALKESVGLSDEGLGPIIVVDTVVGYGWMAVLLFFSGWQARFDRATNARTEALAETNRRLEEMARERHPITLRDAAFLIGLGLAAAVAAVRLGNDPDLFPPLGDPTIISGTTWAILIVVTVGLALSFTPLREYEKVGASDLGYVALYMLLAGIGAQANVREVLAAPLYLVAGMVWISVHIAILFAAARLVRAPLFFIATGSMANIGGAVSAPIVAGVYHRAMAPVGLLMAIVGYVLGIYAALGCAWILGAIAG